MQENMNQKNSEYGHFSRCVTLKFYQLFAKTLAPYNLKTKIIFVNPDEHEYKHDVTNSLVLV